MSRKPKGTGSPKSEAHDIHAAERSLSTWATRKLPPITIERLDAHLDFVAQLVMRWPDRAGLLLPIWRRIKKERERLREEKQFIREAALRLKHRSQTR